MLIKWLSSQNHTFFANFLPRLSMQHIWCLSPSLCFTFILCVIYRLHCISVGKIIIWSPAEILSLLNYKEMMKWNENVANFYCSFNEVDKNNKNTFNFHASFRTLKDIYKWLNTKTAICLKLITVEKLYN